MRRVAKLRGEEWYILSAKHGLLDPETEIEPYDAFGISVEQAESVIQTLQERGHTEATVIAGNKYLAPLRSVCEETGFSLRTIAEGQRIGKRMVKLDELANELQNHGLENYA